MISFPVSEGTAPGYLALPNGGEGPGVVALHEWWGLTEPFRKICDRLAEAGFVTLAPDLYRGKTTASAEEAEALGSALDQDMARWRGDIAGAVQFLRHLEATSRMGRSVAPPARRCAQRNSAGDVMARCACSMLPAFEIADPVPCVSSASGRAAPPRSHGG